MRKKNQKQLPLMGATIDHPHAKELEAMSRVLDRNPIINEMALQDLTQHVNNTETGAEGMSAEQVVRAAIIKQMEDYSYEELAFHLVDSHCYRKFCRVGLADKGFKKSTLCNNIKALFPETWEGINHVVVAYAEDKKIEKGHKVCFTAGSSNLIVDCIIVDGNPADSALTDQVFDRQRDIYGRYPLKAALDGGFASKENLRSAKAKGIKDVCFAKKRGVEVEQISLGRKRPFLDRH